MSAHATGKPLDPREIVLKVGEVMAATGDPVVSPPVGIDRRITIGADSVFERITPEELWACTSCKACDEICPVNIEILDKILDMRRYLTLMESDFPTELGNTYRSMENSGNAYGLNQGDRGEWAASLEGIEIVEAGSPLEHEYLFFVGCAGSFDDRNKKTSRALAKLLQRAGIDFAILGPSELCNGDQARRSGNEYIFQMLATQNIETFNSMGVTKIITQCPHCFNVIKNEYPQLGGNYEVMHHSQLLDELVRDGRLSLAGASLEERVTYHDSCYLGRHNDVYLAPRRVVGSLAGIDLVEMPRNGTLGMCCGAGGARMWMEENIGKRVNAERSQEAIATGASRIAVACPFCYVMLDDGVKGEGKDEQVRVQDIAVICGKRSRDPKLSRLPTIPRDESCRPSTSPPGRRSPAADGSRRGPRSGPIGKRRGARCRSPWRCRGRAVAADCSGRRRRRRETRRFFPARAGARTRPTSGRCPGVAGTRRRPFRCRRSRASRGRDRMY